MRSLRAGPCGARTDRRYRRARPSRSRATSDERCGGAWIPVWYHRRRLAGNSDEPQADDSAIDALVAAGKHLEAAHEAMRIGRYARAADLFEKLWDFRNALEAARAGRDTPRVLRYAIE